MAARSRRADRQLLLVVVDFMAEGVFPPLRAPSPIFVCAWLVFPFITITIARSKGRGAPLWGLLACFLPGITIIVLLLLSSRSRD